jgi:hypothetical protein
LEAELTGIHDDGLLVSHDDIQNVAFGGVSGRRLHIRILGFEPFHHLKSRPFIR